MPRSIEYHSQNGVSIVFGDAPPFFMTSMPTDRLGSDAQIWKPPGMDGIEEYNITRSERAIGFEGAIVANNQQELDRLKARLVTCFDPGRSGRLVYRSNTGNWQLSRCRARDTPQFARPFGNSIRFSVEVTSGGSVWESEREHIASIGSSYANLRFPLFLPPEGSPLSLTFPEAIIDNTSTVDIRPVVEVFDTQGATVNVRNELTGAVLFINRAVASNQKMVIDVAEATVMLYEDMGGVWALMDDRVDNWLTGNLVNFVIPPGENVLNINEELPGEKPTMLVRWRLPAVGV